MIVHWHPDNRIYIRNDDWSIVFEGTKSEAESVLGQSIDDLPPNVRERQLFVGSHCIDFDKKGSQKESKPADWWAGGVSIASKHKEFGDKHKANIEKLKEDARPKKLRIEK